MKPCFGFHSKVFLGSFGISFLGLTFIIHGYMRWKRKTRPISESTLVFNFSIDLQYILIQIPDPTTNAFKWLRARMQLHLFKGFHNEVQIQLEWRWTHSQWIGLWVTLLIRRYANCSRVLPGIQFRKWFKFHHWKTLNANSLSSCQDQDMLRPPNVYIQMDDNFQGIQSSQPFDRATTTDEVWVSWGVWTTERHGVGIGTWSPFPDGAGAGAGDSSTAKLWFFGGLGIWGTGTGGKGISGSSFSISSNILLSSYSNGGSSGCESSTIAPSWVSASGWSAAGAAVGCQSWKRQRARQNE